MNERIEKYLEDEIDEEELLDEQGGKGVKSEQLQAFLSDVDGVFDLLQEMKDQAARGARLKDLIKNVLPSLKEFLSGVRGSEDLDPKVARTKKTVEGFVRTLENLIPTRLKQRDLENLKVSDIINSIRELS